MKKEEISSEDEREEHRSMKSKKIVHSSSGETDTDSEVDTPVSKKKKKPTLRSDSEEDIPKSVSKKKKKPALRSAPKLSYDGNADWDIFKDKFQGYAEQMDWTPSECKACLKWCLTGTASKFCNSLLKTNKDLTYKKLLKKLGDRFGDDDLGATAHAQFNQAIQKKEETLEDWADRVQELAARAFKKLPDDYCNNQAVQMFCEGKLDSEAGHSVIMQDLTTL